jgi:nickel transport protein
MFAGGRRRVTASRLAVAAFCAGVALSCAAAFAASSAMAHGVVLEQSRGEAVEVTATFDSGEPMSEGQVTVYSPADPAEPWATGTTDEKGRYVFMPDESRPGTWSVQVREAGHGASISVEVGESGEGESTDGSDGGGPVETERTSSVGGSPVQTGLMAALGLWGFVGTALFFRGRRG